MFKRKAVCLLVLALAFLLLPSLAFATGAEDDDFDDDSQDDFAVFRPAEGNWYIDSSQENETLVYQLGLPGDIPVHGLYDARSQVDLAVYRPIGGFWFYQTILEDLSLGSLDTVQWGGFPGDIPIPCDFNGDGRMDITVYRGGTWFSLLSRSYDPSDPDDVQIVPWGNPTDRPVPFDVDSDGTCDYVVYRDGAWFVNLSSKDFADGGVINHGAAGDFPIVGRYDGDNITDFAVYRESPGFGIPSVWIIQESRTRGLTSVVIPWGQAGDFPMTKDVDDDGQTDIIVWRPSDGNWYTLLSSDDYAGVDVTQFGLSGDIPLGDRAGVDP